MFFFKLSYILFQFHTGSIKSPSTHDAAAESGVFQFHTGSIKRFAKKFEEGNVVRVSIPYWFD